MASKLHVTEDDLTNAIFYDTEITPEFAGDKADASVLAGSMIIAVRSVVGHDRDFRLVVDVDHLRDAILFGGVLQQSFVGTKAEARKVAKAMLAAVAS